MSWDDLVAAARRGEGPLRGALALRRRIAAFRLPVFRPLAALLYAERDLRGRVWPLIAKILYREPLLRYRAEDVGTGLLLEGALPEITGSGTIRIGNDVTIGGRNSWVCGFRSSRDAEIIVEDRVYIGFQVVLSAAKSIRIGADTMLAARVQIYDNISHPISPARRLRHEPFRLDESTPVVIGRNCWIGNNAMIMRGVTVGDNSIVAAMSVVTRDVPPNTLVGGNPAKVIRSIADEGEDGTDVATPEPIETDVQSGS